MSGLERVDGRTPREPDSRWSSASRWAGRWPLSGLSRWLTEAVPAGRVAAFRTVVYLFVVADLLYFTPWVRGHAFVPGELYQPLLIGRLLPFPTPSYSLVTTVFWVLVAAGLAAATGRAPRLLGWTVFALYLEWMLIAMSYGKVDHDRFGLLVALAVLPTAGVARHGERRLTEYGGWALRITQVAVVSTYFLSTWAKLRFGGIEWLTGATLTRAVLRRGTVFSDWTVHVPELLVVMQVVIVAFELSSPIVFLLSPRLRLWMVGFFYSFHVMVFATITITFMPHQAAMASFLPLERVRPILWLRRAGRRLRRATDEAEEQAPATALDPASTAGAAPATAPAGGPPA